MGLTLGTAHLYIIALNATFGCPGMYALPSVRTHAVRQDGWTDWWADAAGRVRFQLACFCALLDLPWTSPGDSTRLGFASAQKLCHAINRK